MVRDVRAYLWDALEAGKSILTFTHGLDLEYRTAVFTTSYGGFAGLARP